MKRDPTKDIVWEPETYYVVRIKWTKHNVEHLSILYSGFLSGEGTPSGYATVFNPTYENCLYPQHPRDAYSIRIVGKLGTLENMADAYEFTIKRLEDLSEQLKAKQRR